jgi:hypothetical protein
MCQFYSDRSRFFLQPTVNAKVTIGSVEIVTNMKNLNYCQLISNFYVSQPNVTLTCREFPEYIIPGVFLNFTS